MEKARSMLNDMGLTIKFLAEADNTAAYLMNRSPTRTIQSTPEKAWSRKKLALKHSRVFGSRKMVHCPKQKRQKFDPKSTEGIFVGYAKNSKVFRLYNQEEDEVIISRDVVFINEERPLHPIDANDEHQPVESIELITGPEMDDQLP